MLMFSSKGYTFVMQETKKHLIFGIVSLTPDQFKKVQLMVDKDTERMTGIIMDTSQGISAELDHDVVERIYLDELMQSCFNYVFVDKAHNNLEKAMIVRITLENAIFNYQLLTGKLV